MLMLNDVLNITCKFDNGEDNNGDGEDNSDDGEDNIIDADFQLNDIHRNRRLHKNIYEFNISNSVPGLTTYCCIYNQETNYALVTVTVFNSTIEHFSCNWTYSNKDIFCSFQIFNYPLKRAFTMSFCPVNTYTEEKVGL